MKKALFLSLMLFSALSLFSQDGNHGTKYGLQMSSDSMFGFLVYSDKFELSLKGQAKLYDISKEGEIDPNILTLGIHGGYLFNLSDNKTDISAGADIRSTFGLGDLEYEQYIDISPRLAFNYRLGDHFLLTGILYPFHVNMIETSAEDSFILEATMPETAVAVSFLF